MLLKDRIVRFELLFFESCSIDALAKRLQHWRAMLAYQAGHVVSSNIAPSTATLSVVSNRTFAWAYGGMPYFKVVNIILPHAHFAAI